MKTSDNGQYNVGSSEQTTIDRVRAIRTAIRGTLKRERKKLAKQEKEFGEAKLWVWYRQIGDSLLAAPLDYPKGTRDAAVINIHTQEIQDVSLNAKLTVYENAELLYKKAAKGERGEGVIREHVDATRQEIEAFEQLRERCDVLGRGEVCEEEIEEALSQLEISAAELGLEIGGKGGHKKEDQAPALPYRRYEIDGYEMLIGRNTTQNDELSIRFAKPWDVWMHVAAHKGSHCVLRRAKNSDWPPKSVIEKASALAVWFSKAKHTSFAEVHVTEARFVRKRRKAPPGEVIAERCRTVRVAPVDPREMFGRTGS